MLASQPIATAKPAPTGPAPSICSEARVVKALAIVTLTLLVYIPAMTAGFLWEDDQAITANPSLLNTNDNYGLWEIWTGGLTTDKDAAGDPAVVKALRVPLQAVEKYFWPEKQFKAHESAEYTPLKTSMHWLEFQLWGRNHDGNVNMYADHQVNPFHVINILLHAIDALLIWLLLSQLKVPGAWLAGLLFAIHPVHVESVAWITGRKNTLSLLFYLLAISAWVKSARNASRGAHGGEDKGFTRRDEDTKGLDANPCLSPCPPCETFSSPPREAFNRFYFLSLLFFLAALLCRNTVVVLPAVLLLCTWWRTGRLTLRDWLLAAPFFAISAAFVPVTLWFQDARCIGSEVIPIGDFWSRLAGAGFAGWWYLEKALLPLHLNTLYNTVPILPPAGPRPSQFIKGAILIIALFGSLAAYLRYDKRRTRIGRTPFFVLAYFLGTLFPVLGFFRMSYMRVALQADQFQYHSDVAIVALAAAGIAYGWRKASSRVKPLIVGACVLLVFTCCAYSWVRAGVHQSEKTLWTACLEKNPDSWQAHNHLGAVVYMERAFAQAHYHFQRAVALKPENPEVHNNLGLTLSQFGQTDEALAQFRRAVEIKGDVPAMRRNYADCLVRTNRFDEAATQFQTVLEQDPNDINSRLDYGGVLLQLRHPSQAREQFEAVLKVNPRNQHARQGLEAAKKML